MVRRLLVLLAALVLGACAAPTPPPAPADDAGARLRRLMDASDEAWLDRNPVFALYRGDTRRAAQHGDYGSAAYVDGERRAAEDDLAQLSRIPREQLSAVDRIAFDTFRWARTDARERFMPPATAIWPLLQLDQMNGWHVFFPSLSSGEGVAPYRNVADYEHGLARLDGFIAWLDGAVQRMREGQRTGITLPRVLAQRVAEQFERFAAQGVDASPYYGPIRKLPQDMPAADRERLARAYAEAVEQRLRPAFGRTHEFFATQYLPAARTSVGLSALPGGAAFYELLIRSNTTMALSADQVHRMGLAEVARITTGMDGVRRQVGFPGSLAQFFEHLRSDPRYAPRDAAALADGYAGIRRRVEAAMPRLFDLSPRTPLEIRPTPAHQAATDAGARYVSGSLDSGQPGVFFFNTSDLPSRRLWGMETLYLHEAVPGHHLQTALAAENQALPKLLRYDGNTAYIEGWALYAESLGPELGLFQDPYQRFGHYNDEMLRAMRLVVDTGLHAFGWSREQAIEYMLAHSAMSETEVVAEVERYIADPGQALAYKVGALTLQRLRQRAEKALGSRFDIRAFHRQVLDTGALPLSVLEAKIEAWIATP